MDFCQSRLVPVLFLILSSLSPTLHAQVVTDPPRVEFTVTSVRVLEGATVDLTLTEVNGTGSCDVDVFTFSPEFDPAIPGVDFSRLREFGVSVPSGGSVSLPSITIFTDMVTPEAIESFAVAISPTTGEGANPCDITNNDFVEIEIVDVPAATPPLVAEFTLDTTEITVDEGGMALVDVFLSSFANSNSVCAVDIATEPGSASEAPPADFSPLSRTIMVSASSPTSLEIPIDADSLIEGNEDFTVILSVADPAGGSVEICDLGPDSVAEITIVDTTPPPAPPLVAEITSQTTEIDVDEGDNAIINVELTGLVSDNSSCEVNIATFPDTATSADFTPQVTTLTVNPGSTTSLTVPTATDSINENEEIFTVVLSETDPDEATIQICDVGLNNTATVTILDIPPPATLVDFAPPTAINVAEGGTATVEVIFSPFSSNSNTCDVDIRTSPGTASNVTPADFTPQSTTLTVSSQGTTLDIPIATDSIIEGNEFFFVVLSETDSTSSAKSSKTGPLNTSRESSNPACVVGLSSTVRVTITDTTVPPVPPPVAEFTPATTNITINEGGTAMVDVFVSSFSGNDNVCLIDVATVPGSASDVIPADFTPQFTTLTVSDSPATTLPITIANDALIEGSEDFTVILSVASPGNDSIPVCDVGANNTATITIEDTTVPPAPPPVAEFTAATTNVTVTEGGTATVDVFVSSFSGNDNVCLIDVATVPGSASDVIPADFTPQFTTLTISDSPATALPIQIANDALIEGSEDFTVVLSVASPGNDSIPVCDVGANNTATITIEDTTVPPAPPPVAEFTAATTNVTVTEGGTATVDVFVSSFSGNDSMCLIDVATVPGSASAETPADFTPQFETLTLSPSPATPLTIPVATDALIEGNEDFTVVLGVASSDGSSIPICDIGANDTAMVTIVDIPPPPPVAEITAATTAITVIEGGTATVDVFVSSFSGNNSTCDIDVATVAASASDVTPADFTPQFTTLTVSPSPATSLLIPVATDMLNEDDEEFTVILSQTSNSANGNLLCEVGSNAISTVTITDLAPLAPPIVQFTTSSVLQTFNEGSGSAEVRLVLSGGTGPGSVDVSTSTGSASNGDFTSLSSETISVPSGVQLPVTIDLTDDDIIESNEQFTVTITATPGSNTIIGPLDEAMVEIVDNDEPVIPGTIQFANSAVTVDEDENVVTLIVTRTNGDDGDISVIVDTDAGSATLGADYANTTIPLDWEDGDSSDRTVTVPIVFDQIAESDEVFTVNLMDASPDDSVIGSPATATITINDVFNGTPGTLQFSQDSYSVNEDAGFVTIEVTRTGGSDGTVSIAYDTDQGSATLDTDYTNTSGTLTWTDGDTAPQTFTVAITDDGIDEETEQFTVTLQNAEPVGVAQIGSPSLATVSILNINPPAPEPEAEPEPQNPGIVQFELSEITVAEDIGSVLVNVTRTGGSDGELTIPFTTNDGSAIAGEDYNAITDTVFWADGEVEPQQITLTLLANNDTTEANEQFSVTLSDPVGSPGIVGSPSVINITIVDVTPEQPGLLQFVSDSVTVNETDGSITVFVERVGGSDGVVAVNYSTSTTAEENGAIDGEDFTGSSGELVWDDGEITPQPVTVTILNDSIAEQAEIFFLSLSGATPFGDEIQLGTNNQVTVTINPDQINVGTIRFVARETVNVDERNNTVAVNVERVNGSEGPASVTFATRDGSAIAGLDYTAQSDELNWENGESGIRTITLSILDDFEIENESEFFIDLIEAFPVGNDLQLEEGRSQHSVQFSDDTNQSGQFRFAQSALTAEEGNDLTIEVQRIGGTEGNVSLAYAVREGSATNDDYNTPASNELNWNPGDSTSRTILLEINADSIAEEEEQLAIDLVTAFPIGNDTQFADPRRLTVTIPAQQVNAGILRFAAASLTSQIEETEGATVSLVVERVGGTDGNVSVEYEISSTEANFQDDYSPDQGTLTWNSGDNSQRTIDIQITDDDIPENPETLSVNLVRAFPIGNDVQLAGQTSATIVVTDNDTAIVENPVEEPAAEEPAAEEPVAEEPVAEEPVATEPEAEETPTEPTAVIPPLADAQTNPFILIPLETEQQAGGIGQEFTELGFLVEDTRNNNAPAPGVTIRWSVEPADAAVFPDGTVTTSDENGIATNRIVVTTSGTIRIVAEAEFGQSEVMVITMDGDSTTVGPVGEPVDEEPVDEEPVVEGPPIEEPQTEEPQNDEQGVTTPLADSQTNPFILTPLASQQQTGDLGEEFTQLGFLVEDTRNDNAPAPGVTIRWSVEPAGAAVFPDGTVTTSDENGIATNRIIVTMQGTIRIVAEAEFDLNPFVASGNVLSKAFKPIPWSEQLVTRMLEPFDGPPNTNFFLIMVGIANAANLTPNELAAATALDNACAALNLEDGNLVPIGDDTSGTVSVEQQQSLIQICNNLLEATDPASALDIITAEEYFQIADSLVELSDLQLTNVYARINSIRSGNQDTLDLSGLNLNIYDQRIPGSVVNAAQNALYENYVSGGAAAAGDEAGIFNTSKRGFFISGSAGFGSVNGGIDDRTGVQQDADFQISQLTAGFDYKLGSNMVIGAGVGYANSDTDFSFEDGGVNNISTSLTLFGTWWKPDTGYLDLVVDLGVNEFDMERPLNLDPDRPSVLALGKTDATVTSFTFGFGRNFTVAGWETGPYGRLSATSAQVDGFSERTTSSDAEAGSLLDISSHEIRSATFSIGGQVSKSINTSKAVVVPQFRFEYELEREENKKGITSIFQADPNRTPFTIDGNDRDTGYLNIGLGASAVFPRGHSGFLFYESRQQQDNVEINYIKAGYRYDF